MKIWQLAWCLLLVIAASFAEADAFTRNDSIRERFWGRGRRFLGLSEDLSHLQWIETEGSLERKLLEADPGALSSHFLISHH